MAENREYKSDVFSMLIKGTQRRGVKGHDYRYDI